MELFAYNVEMVKYFQLSHVVILWAMRTKMCLITHNMSFEMKSYYYST